MLSVISILSFVSWSIIVSTLDYLGVWLLLTPVDFWYYRDLVNGSRDLVCVTLGYRCKAQATVPESDHAWPFLVMCVRT